MSLLALAVAVATAFAAGALTGFLLPSPPRRRSSIGLRQNGGAQPPRRGRHRQW